jgi:hypothetical protein
VHSYAEFPPVEDYAMLLEAQPAFGGGGLHTI